MNNRQLFRIPSKSTLGGVAAGVADYFGMETSVVRLIFVLLLVFSGGAMFIAYVILWAALPKAEALGYDNLAVAPPSHIKSGLSSNGAQTAGIVLILLGSLLLFKKLFHWIYIGPYVPAIVLIGLGLFLILKSGGFIDSTHNTTTANPDTLGPKTFEDTKATEVAPSVEDKKPEEPTNN